MDELSQPNPLKECNSKAQSDSLGKMNYRDDSQSIRKPVDFKVQLLQDDFETLDSSRNISFLKDNLSAAVKPNRPAKQDSFASRLIKQLSAKIHRTQIIEILSVTSTCQRDLKSFQWGWIDAPKVGDQFYSSNLLMTGWLIGRGSQPSRINFLLNDVVIATTPIHISRPDVAKAHFFQYPNCGYKTILDITTFSGKAEIVMQAVFPEGYTAVSGSITLRKYG